MNQEDLDKVLDYVLPLAQDQLGKMGDFAPFAAALNAYGTVDTVTGQAADGASTDRDVMDLLVKALRHHAKPRGYKLTAICYSARVRPPEPGEPFQAIAVAVEQPDSEARMVYLPYEKGADGEYSFGELLGAEGEPRVFDRPKEG